MDMDAMVTDSHQLMMSEEQRHHLFKVRRALLSVCVGLFLSASNMADASNYLRPSAESVLVPPTRL